MPIIPAFMDERINEFYKQETQLSLLYKIFAGIAIFISCLGLYGLVSFMVAQRTKEVGISKVLGASVINLIYLFSKEFTILVLIAFALAIPAAYYMMNNWLSNFTFRINIFSLDIRPFNTCLSCYCLVNGGIQSSEGRIGQSR